jgi:hypothetical protein
MALRRRNLVCNPSAEGGAETALVVAPVITATLNGFSGSSFNVQTGVRSFFMEATGNAGGATALMQWQGLLAAPNAGRLPVEAGDVLTASAVGCYIVDKPAAAQRFYIDWRNAAGASISVSSGSPVPAIGDQVPPPLTATAPVGAVAAGLFFGNFANLGEGEKSTFWIDGLMLGDDGPYFDGDTPGYRWEGVPYGSPSSNPAPPPRRHQNPPLQFILDGRDVTAQLGDQFSFSNADPGGFEMASLTLSRVIQARRGAPLVIRAGLQIVWMGRVSENQPTFSTSVQCEGIGARLKDGRMREVYVDRSVSSWGEPPLARAREIADSGLPQGKVQVRQVEGGLVWDVPNETLPNLEDAERWWHIADGLDAAAVAYKGSRTGAFTNFEAPTLYSAQGDTATGVNSQTLTLDDTVRTVVLTEPRPRLFVRTFVNAGATTPAAGHQQRYTFMAVVGGHGLALRLDGDGLPGFSPDDIARDALRRTDGIVEGVFQQAAGFVVPHSVYPDPVPHEQPIDDMAKLVGFHWGVWEPLSIFDMTPRLDFRAPPTEPTVFCSRADMAGEPDLSERLADLYDTVQVSWTDSGGSKHLTERTASIPELTAAGIDSRVLSIDKGLATEASADLFASYVLGLQRPQSRASGSVVLPGTVGTGSGRKAAMLLQAGLDRLAITDLSVGGAVLSGPPHFRVRRVEVTGSRSGVSTTVSLDAGSNLIEVLVAQLALKTQIAAG